MAISKTFKAMIEERLLKESHPLDDLLKSLTKHRQELESIMYDLTATISSIKKIQEKRK